MKEGFQPKWESLQQGDRFKLSDKNISGTGKLHFSTTKEKKKKKKLLPGRNSDSERRQRRQIASPCLLCMEQTYTHRSEA